MIKHMSYQTHNLIFSVILCKLMFLFQILDVFIPRDYKESCEAAQEATNSDKNRDPDILPSKYLKCSKKSRESQIFKLTKYITFLK